jgi:hypothetical protein
MCTNGLRDAEAYFGEKKSVKLRCAIHAAEMLF